MRWIFFFISSLTSFALADAGVTYHGRLLDPSGLAVKSPVVQFRLQIRSPGSENCLLYEEIQTKDLSQTNGIFALNINESPSFRVDASGVSFDRVFSNQGTFNLTGLCAIGSSYTPNYADNRRLEVSFNDGTFAGWEPLPSQRINFVPLAMESLQVGGFTANNLLRVANGTVPQTVTPLSSTQFGELMALILGTSTQYSKTNQLNGSALPALTAGQSLGWTGSAWSAVTPITSETDPTVQAFAKVALPTCAAGQILKSNGSAFQCVTDTAGTLSLTEADIPTLTSPGKVSGSAITSGTIGGSSSLNTTGTVTTTSLTANSVGTQSLRIFENTNTYRINLLAPGSLGANYGLTFPTGLPSVAGQVLSSDLVGNLSWVTPSGGGGSGTVTSVGITTPAYMSATGGPVTTSGSIAIGFASQSQNAVFAGPASGSGAPSFRSLSVSDLRSTVSGAWFTASGACPAGSQLSFDSLNDKIDCAAYTITSGQVTGALGFTPGSVTSVTAGVGLATTPGAGITTTGSIGIAAGGVGTTELASGAVTNAKINDVSVSKVTSGAGAYLSYAPNGSNCSANQVLKWNAVNSRWECGNDIDTNTGITSESDPTVAAFSKNAPSSDFSTPSGVLTLQTVPVSKGGTGATTAAAAANAILPSQTGHSGKVLQTDGTNPSWVTPSGGGASLQSGVTLTVTAGTACSTIGQLAKTGSADLLVCESDVNAYVSTSCSTFGPGAITFDSEGSMYVCTN